MMLKYTEGYLKLDDVRIHYYRTGGKKPPFLLLHGATDNGLCWTRTAESLAETYDVIMPDAQGHGLSDRLGKDFTHKRFVEQAGGLCLALGLNKPLIMGHSLGAGTAAGVAIEYPSLPRAIILEDPPWGEPPAGAEEAEKARKEGMARFNRLIGLRDLAVEEIIAVSRGMDPRWPEEERLPWARAKQQFDASLFAYPIINQSHYSELVPQIKCPTLLIIAENGIVSPGAAANAARLWKSKKPFKWVQIKGTTHNIRRDNFEDFKSALFGFLETLPG
jgi:pimeloyl-ACP methyl ester carboxylesterase